MQPPASILKPSIKADKVALRYVMLIVSSCYLTASISSTFLLLSRHLYINNSQHLVKEMSQLPDTQGDNNWNNNSVFGNKHFSYYF